MVSLMNVRVSPTSMACLLALAVTNCRPISGNLEQETAGAALTNASDAGADADGATVADDEYCESPIGSTRRDAVCHRWRCDARFATAPARWTGSASSCDAGGVDDGAVDRALAAINLHRFLADVPPLLAEPTWSKAAQDCALVAHANRRLSHTPTPDWTCWSDLAASASAVSLIANRSAPPAVAALIEDPGNATTLVHRRWLLSEELLFVGFGSTDRYSCIVVDGRSIDRANGTTSRRTRPASETESVRHWTAWPPPGPVPFDVFASERLDEVGWTVQSSLLDLEDAKVLVTVDGEAAPIHLTHLAPHEGSASAVSFAPDGWRTETGHVYRVTVDGDAPISFSVEPTDCE
jgi:hypothetical protein